MKGSSRIAATLVAATLLAAIAAESAAAGDCTGYVVGVRSISQYDHQRGNGFLAVRSGPGGRYRQVGELYAGDEVSVYDRSGPWLAVTCMSGRCTNPLWGQPMPSGWAHGRYISAGGVCP